MLRVFLFVVWVGVSVPAATALLDGRVVLGGALAAVSLLVLGAEWAAGKMAADGPGAQDGGGGA